MPRERKHLSKKSHRSKELNNGRRLDVSGRAGGEPRQAGADRKAVAYPPAGHVRIRVEACGVCHSDSATVEGILPIQWPRVPGHEAVGRIDVMGEGVEGWAVADASASVSSAAAAGTASTVAMVTS